MTSRTIFTLTKEECKVLEQAAEIMIALDENLFHGSYLTPYDIKAVSYLAQGKALPSQNGHKWYLNATSYKNEGYFTLKEGEQA